MKRKFLLLIIMTILLASTKCSFALEEGVNYLPEKIDSKNANIQINEELRKLYARIRNDRMFVSRTTFTADNSQTITGLEPGYNYLLFLEVKAGPSDNEDLLIYPNGTLSTALGSTDYVEWPGDITGVARLHQENGFNSGGNSLGSWILNFRTIGSDETRTRLLFEGYTDADAGNSHAYVVFDSDEVLSAITIRSQGGSMVLTGTADLYRYSIN